jgi:hypothetical protein
MARLYNSASFKPDNVVPAVECAAIQPGNVRFHHTRTPDKLKEKYKELKKNISVVQGNYEKIGQNDPDKTQADFTDDKPLLYCWLRLDAAGFLEDFGTRRLPGVCRGLGGGCFAPFLGSARKRFHAQSARHLGRSKGPELRGGRCSRTSPFLAVCYRTTTSARTETQPRARSS